jgi:hypothetical protein
LETADADEAQTRDVIMWHDTRSELAREESLYVWRFEPTRTPFLYHWYTGYPALDVAAQKSTLVPWQILVLLAEI